jgi:hypothetical protein
MPIESSTFDHDKAQILYVDNLYGKITFNNVAIYDHIG